MFSYFPVNIGREREKEKGVKDEQEKEKVADSNDTSMMSGDSVSLPSLKVGNLINRPSSESMSYNPTSRNTVSSLFSM